MPLAASAATGALRNQPVSSRAACQATFLALTRILLTSAARELEDVLLAEVEDRLVERRLERRGQEDDPRVVLALGEEGLVERILHADEEPDGRVLALDPKGDLRLRDLVGGQVLGLLLDDALDAEGGQGVDEAADLDVVGRRLERRGQPPRPRLVPLEGQGLAVPDEAHFADIAGRRG